MGTGGKACKFGGHFGYFYIFIFGPLICYAVTAAALCREEKSDSVIQLFFSLLPCYLRCNQEHDTTS